MEEGDRRRRIQHSCDKTKDEFISLKNQAAVSERREREHELVMDTFVLFDTLVVNRVFV